MDYKWSLVYTHAYKIGSTSRTYGYTVLLHNTPLSQTKSSRFPKHSLSNMLFYFALLGLATALVPRPPAPAASGVCTSAPYNKLAPLAYFPDAQKFCSKKYPQTVTVTAGPKLRRGISTTTSSATTPYTTPATTPAPTTRASTTSTRSTTSAEKCTKNPLECLYSSVKKGEKNGVAATVRLLLAMTHGQPHGSFSLRSLA